MKQFQHFLIGSIGFIIAIIIAITILLLTSYFSSFKILLLIFLTLSFFLIYRVFYVIKENGFKTYLVWTYFNLKFFPLLLLLQIADIYSTYHFTDGFKNISKEANLFFVNIVPYNSLFFIGLYTIIFVFIFIFILSALEKDHQKIVIFGWSIVKPLVIIWNFLGV